MSFWSSQKLQQKLKAENIICSPRDEALDCNAYTLRIGAEVYVSPTFAGESSVTQTKRKLQEGEAFTIPPGQFSFLITEESVHVPTNAMAFISIKAQIKFRGLVNVSGFHVDPGWNGPLIFSVFNAGPAAVHLQRGQDMFLIWFADLDEDSERHKTKPGSPVIPPGIINNITGELNSFDNLSKTIAGVNDKLSERLHAIEKWQIRVLLIFGAAVTIFVGMIGYALRPMVVDWFGQRPPAQSTAAPNTSTTIAE